MKKLKPKWQIKFKPEAARELRKLDEQIARRIIKYMRGYVATLENPRIVGRVLHGSLSEYWRYQVGDWRIIVSIEDKKMIIWVVKVGNRREVYR